MMHRPLPDDWPSHGNLVAEFMEDMWIFWGEKWFNEKKRPVFNNPKLEEDCGYMFIFSRKTK